MADFSRVGQHFFTSRPKNIVQRAPRSRVAFPPVPRCAGPFRPWRALVRPARRARAFFVLLPLLGERLRHAVVGLGLYQPGNFLRRVGLRGGRSLFRRGGPVLHLCGLYGGVDIFCHGAISLCFQSCRAVLGVCTVVFHVRARVIKVCKSRAHERRGEMPCDVLQCSNALECREHFGKLMSYLVRHFFVCRPRAVIRKTALRGECVDDLVAQ